MFKKHQFTCPDVIYVRNQQKKTALATFGIYGLVFGALAIAARRSEKQFEQDLETNETPVE
jgi:hypothetical protein